MEPGATYRSDRQRCLPVGNRRARMAPKTENFALNRSGQSSAKRVGRRIFSRNFCLCLPHGRASKDDRHRKSGRSRRPATVAWSTLRPLPSMRPTEGQASADQLPAKAQRPAIPGQVNEARLKAYGARLRIVNGSGKMANEPRFDAAPESA